MHSITRFIGIAHDGSGIHTGAWLSGWGHVVLHAHMFRERVRSSEGLVTLGPWTRKRLFTRMTAQVAQ